MAWAIAAPIIGAVVSGLLSNRGAKDANQSSAQMAREQMEFQERMSNTAHQREVDDLLAAGLNPILSGTGGAGSSTPSGATSTFSNEYAGFAGLSQAASSAVQARQMNQELLNAKKMWQLLEEQRRKTANEADVTAEEHQIRRVNRTIAEEFGASSAQAQNRLIRAAVPEAETAAELWKDMGEGGEVLKGAGAAAPLLRILMQLFRRGQ